MTNESPVLVLVSLSNHGNHPTQSKKDILGCQLKIHDSEVTFYNGGGKYILHAVLPEMSKNAS